MKKIVLGLILSTGLIFSAGVKEINKQNNETYGVICTDYSGGLVDIDSASTCARKIGGKRECRPAYKNWSVSEAAAWLCS
jgi:hypothetical protein